MRTQALIAGWIGSAFVLLVAMFWLVGQWNTLGRLGASAQQDLTRLTAELETQRQAIQTELASNAEVMRRLRWSPERGAAGETVRRLAALAHGGQAKVLAISTLDGQSTPRFRKSWHRITMTSPFTDLIDFAAKVEQEGALLEDVVIEPVSGDDRAGRTGDLRAEFRLTAVEPSAEGRAIMDRALAAAKAAGTPVAAALTLPVQESAAGAAGLRDPFRPLPKPKPPVVVAATRPAAAGTSAAAVAAPPAPAAPPASGAPPPPPAPVVPIAVKGIVKFPGGTMAIVNEQIVGVGDVVDGHRIQEIADGRVVLAVPGGEPRIAQLPGFGAAPRGTR